MREIKIPESNLRMPTCCVINYFDSEHHYDIDFLRVYENVVVSNHFIQILVDLLPILTKKSNTMPRKKRMAFFKLLILLFLLLKKFKRIIFSPFFIIFSPSLNFALHTRKILFLLVLSVN